MVYSWWSSTLERLFRRESVSQDRLEEHGVHDTTTPLREHSEDRTKQQNHQVALRTSAMPAFVHVKQVEAWDCGVACLLMVWTWLATTNTAVRAPNPSDLDQQRRHLLQVLNTKSIWTIDLVYALQCMQTQQRLRGEQQKADKHFDCCDNFEYKFYSTVLEQANTAWKEYAYYAAAFDCDQQRIRQRFLYLQESSPQCIEQFVQAMSIDWVVDYLRSPSTVAILLVDNTLLQRLSQKEQLTEGVDSAALPSSSQTYTGHYLLVIGIASPTESDQSSSNYGDVLLLVYNPDAGIQHMPIRHVEKAWQASGTDQDVIFIRKIEQDDKHG